MKPRSYTQALSQLLEPLGFERTGSDWIRRASEIEESVNLQKSWIDGGVTVNLRSVDTVASQILHEADSSGSGQLKWWVDERIGHLFGPYDKWWKNDPKGPEDVANMVREYGLPFLEKMRDPHELAKRFGLDVLLHGDWRQGAAVGKLAIVLHRMGEHELACRALDVPRRRHEFPGIIAQIEGLRRRFKCPPTANWPDA